MNSLPVYTIIKAMRPRQWTKNVLLLAGLFFARASLPAAALPAAVGRALGGFVVFCLLSGAMYLLNDAIDVEKDRQHPRKCKRPIASGALPVRTALVAMGVALAAALLLAGAISTNFLLCALAYLLLMVPYSLALKNVFLIDTLIIAMGFIIRAVSGVIALRTPQNSVPLTSWFVICVMFLALFVAFAKRRGERLNLDQGAAAFRAVLGLYTAEMLDMAIGICAAGAILSYALYATTSADPWGMLATLPFVLYGIFRYLHLIYYKQEGEAPELVLTKDLPLLGCVALWVVSLAFVYFPKH